MIPYLILNRRDVVDLTKKPPEEPDIICEKVITPEDLLIKVSQKTKIDLKMIKDMLTYNVFTLKQFSILSGLSVSAINIKARYSYVNRTMLSPELDVCHPFKSNASMGLKCIIRNEKSEKYLQL